MTRRRVSSPPEIIGYTYSKPIGMGGFADVFLYQQVLPIRPVAVKVLLSWQQTDETRLAFQQEANMMAQLSHHPSIVTVYQAGFARDGRPYLIMEYCSRPGIGARYRNETISVSEALRVGVRLASAVELAHRAGILHRDIKPANVLVTDFGWPALTDFGIAATVGPSSGEAKGMSIPWSPPEMLGEHPYGDTRADIYSLAATIYSVLARRSPFEVPGGPNDSANLVARIQREGLPRIERDDVPGSLQGVLGKAMAKNPDHRYSSAYEIAQALQRIQAELGLPITPIELTEEVANTEHRVDPSGAPWPRTARESEMGVPATSSTPRGLDPDGALVQAVRRSPVQIDAEDANPTRLRARLSQPAVAAGSGTGGPRRHAGAIGREGGAPATLGAGGRRPSPEEGRLSEGDASDLGAEDSTSERVDEASSTVWRRVTRRLALRSPRKRHDSGTERNR